MLRRLAFVALLFAYLGLAAPARAQDEGLLLGLRYEEPISKVPPYYAGRADSLVRSDYHTLLITKRNGKISVAGDAEDLLVPRANGFWRVGAKRSVYNDWVEDFIFAAPESVAPRYAGIQPFNGEHCRGNRTQRIRYAGEAYLALEQYSAGYCEGAAHPWQFHTLAVVPIDSTSHIGLPISDVLGTAGRDALYAAAADFRTRLRNDTQRMRYAEEPDEANWAIVRKEGRWTLIGRLDAASEAAQGTYADFELPVAPPVSLAGHNQLVPAWNKIRAVAPDAVDAFSSPSRDFVVIVQRTRLTAHPVRNGEIGPAAVTLRLRAGTEPVMARWALGEHVATWVEHIDRFPASSLSSRNR